MYVGNTVEARTLARSRIAAALEVVKGKNLINIDRIGVVGYCFGGAIALEAARVNDPGVSVHASFHPNDLLSPIPATEIDSSVIVVIGSEDNTVPMEGGEVGDFLTEMNGAVAGNWEIHIPGGVQHGYTMFDDPRFDAEWSNKSHAYFIDELGAPCRQRDEATADQNRQHLKE